MSLKWLRRSGFPSGLRALAESFSRKYLILAMTDNVVRPPDGFYAVITSAPPSMALWIIQDYVVIPLILIALRFQSKRRNSEAALRSGEVLSGRHRLDLRFFPFALCLSPRLRLSWSMKKIGAPMLRVHVKSFNTPPNAIENRPRRAGNTLIGSFFFRF